MYRVELSVLTRRVRIVYEDSTRTVNAAWSDDAAALRDWRDSCDEPELVEALNEALNILGVYRSRGIRTRLTSWRVGGVGGGVVDIHSLRDESDDTDFLDFNQP